MRYNVISCRPSFRHHHLTEWAAPNFENSPFCLTVIFLFILGLTSSIEAQDREPPNEIQWPSTEFRTIQEAIDALPVGGKLKFAPGIFRVEAPIFIRKRVVLEGAGCSFELPVRVPKGNRVQPQSIKTRPRRKFTRLVGPRPDRVVDFDRALATFNFMGPEAGGTVKGLEVQGFDAGFAIRNGAAEPPRDARPEPLTIIGSCASNTGRGLVVGRHLPLAVINSAFTNSLLNGISVSLAKPFVGDSLIVLKGNFIEHAFNSCMHFENTFVIVADTNVFQCQSGIGAINSNILIFNTGVFAMDGPGITLVDSAGSILDNTQVNSTRIYGIGLFNSGFSIYDSTVTNTAPRPQDGFFGDGIDAFFSVLTVHNSLIEDSPRAGLANFGGNVSLGDTQIKCAGYELEGEAIFGFNFLFTDFGGNGCGCPSATGVCAAESAGIQPPEPAASIK